MQAASLRHSCGRGIGSGLAVGPDAVPVFPPAGHLSTASAALTPSPRRRYRTNSRQSNAAPGCGNDPFPASQPCRASLARRGIASQSLRRKPCGRKPQNRFKKSLKIKKNRPARYAAKLSTPDFYGMTTPLTPGDLLLLRPAISGTLQPEPFEVEMMAKSHADAGRRGSGVSVGREG